MKPITEQRRQEIIEHAKEMLELMKSYSSNNGYSARSIQVIEIALASLTAVPVMAGKELYDAITDIQNRVMSLCGRYASLRRQTGIGEENMSPIYTAPPVPVIKFPEINLRIAGYRHAPSAPTKEWAFMDGAKWMASETKRLNGLGE